MSFCRNRVENTFIAIISIAFLFWSAFFVYQSSFVGIDGNRYYSLFDDAMISMRYAWNFSHGSGLVWNSGEIIQGYTNLLMTLVMSAVTFLFEKSNSVLVIQILGVGFMLSIACVAARISSFLASGEGHWFLIRTLTFFCALTYYPLMYWSLMGMETGLLTLLLLLGVLFAFKSAQSGSLFEVFLVAFFLGLACLTRTDSVIFSLLVWFYLAWECVSKKNFNYLFFKLPAAIAFFCCFFIGQMLFQFWYYGEALPNTYILKLTGMSLFHRVESGVGFIKPFLSEMAFVLVLAAMSLLFGFQKKKLLLLAIIFSSISYQVYVGGDPWNYWRIMAPTIPLAFVLAISTIVAFTLTLKRFRITKLLFLRSTTDVAPNAMMVGLVLIVWIFANLRFFPEILFSKKPYQVEANIANINTAIAIREVTTTSAAIGVYWAGSIPYYTGRMAIDFLGKSDKYIASLAPDISGNVAWSGMKSVPGHNKYDLNYSIKALKPTYVQDFRWGRDDLSEWAEKEYVEADYKGVRLFLLRSSPMVFWHKVSLINAP